MLRHPQNSGLQMDQLTRLYIPPFFIENLKIWQGDDLVLAMDGGIAISEDPNIRFNYRPNGAANFRAEAVDTSKHVFKDEWPIESPCFSDVSMIESEPGRASLRHRLTDRYPGSGPTWFARKCFNRTAPLRSSEFPLPPARAGIPATASLACSVDEIQNRRGP